MEVSDYIDSLEIESKYKLVLHEELDMCDLDYAQAAIEDMDMYNTGISVDGSDWNIFNGQEAQEYIKDVLEEYIGCINSETRKHYDWLLNAIDVKHLAEQFDIYDVCPDALEDTIDGETYYYYRA